MIIKIKRWVVENDDDGGDDNNQNDNNLFSLQPRRATLRRVRTQSVRPHSTGRKCPVWSSENYRNVQ